MIGNWYAVVLRLESLPWPQLRNFACELIEAADPCRTHAVNNAGGARTTEPYPQGGADTWPHVRIPVPGECIGCRQPAYAKGLCRVCYDRKRPGRSGISPPADTQLTDFLTYEGDESDAA